MFRPSSRWFFTSLIKRSVWNDSFYTALRFSRPRHVHRKSLDLGTPGKGDRIGKRRRLRGKKESKALKQEDYANTVRAPARRMAEELARSWGVYELDVRCGLECYDGISKTIGVGSDAESQGNPSVERASIGRDGICEILSVGGALSRQTRMLETRMCPGPAEIRCRVDRRHGTSRNHGSGGVDGPVLTVER